MKHCLILLLTILSLASFTPAAEKNSQLNIDSSGLAIQGYDPVSYFSNEPQPGRSEFETVLNGARYRFINRQNKDLFEKRPENYLPAYGGWCAWAMLDGDKVSIDPKTYKILNGTNYLFYNGFWGNTLKKWNSLAREKGERSLIKKADSSWKELMSQ